VGVSVNDLDLAEGGQQTLEERVWLGWIEALSVNRLNPGRQKKQQ
jgi:hypothetical protein